MIRDATFPGVCATFRPHTHVYAYADIWRVSAAKREGNRGEICVRSCNSVA